MSNEYMKKVSDRLSDVEMTDDLDVEDAWHVPKHTKVKSVEEMCGV